MTAMPEIGLYIHIPFCRTRCHFCAFYLELYRSDAADAFVAALLTEIHLYKGQDPFKGRALSSIYFGGGTPTVLSAAQLRDILEAARRTFSLQPDTEISIEAHPDSVSIEGLSMLRNAGFTRLSLGIESMNEGELIRVGRPTTTKAAATAARAARQAGFTNMNLDLIYGLPRQTLASWRSTLLAAMALNPTHLSCYALTVETDTRLEADIRRKAIRSLDHDLQIEMEATAEQLLTEAGYQRYEISNYAHPGYACRHNLLYWTGGEYLGLGPSAQSYVQGCRFGNVGDLVAYGQHLKAGTLPIDESEQLAPDQRRREALVFGLRLMEGVPRSLLPAAQEETTWDQTMQQLLSEELLEERNGKIRLTSLGRRYADSVAIELL